jgi:hypothetical protein
VTSVDHHEFNRLSELLLKERGIRTKSVDLRPEIYMDFDGFRLILRYHLWTEELRPDLVIQWSGIKEPDTAELLQMKMWYAYFVVREAFGDA